MRDPGPRGAPGRGRDRQPSDNRARHQCLPRTHSHRTFSSTVFLSLFLTLVLATFHSMAVAEGIEPPAAAATGVGEMRPDPATHSPKLHRTRRPTKQTRG